MSRLYGRAFDVFQISKYIKEHEIPKYTENNKKITIDGLIDSSGILGLYLPDSAIDFIKNHNGFNKENAKEIIKLIKEQ